MEGEVRRVLSLRLTRRIDRSNNQSQKAEEIEDGLLSPGKTSHDPPTKIVWGTTSKRFVLVAAILWTVMFIMLLFQVRSCQSSRTYLTGICRKDSTLFMILDTMGFVPKPAHRCPIPLANNPDSVGIPERGSSETIPQYLSYILVDELEKTGNQSLPLFGGHQSWLQRDKSFELNTTMKVHCGFIQNGGAEMDAMDINYVKKCKFVVASGIFDGYDVPHQPSNISLRSQKLFCFLMVVDEKSLDYIRNNASITEDSDGGKWVGIWRLVLLHKLPFDEPRRNGKVPKILTHRLFPQARYSIWIDGKMELIVDPLLILERYLWREGNTFAVARHKHHQSIFEEADAIKRRKRYSRPLIDLHMKIYRYEGLEPWSPKKKTISDVPEGAIIIREHTALTNLFCCLWFNEVNLFTPRDQLSFGYVVYRLGGSFKFFMFPNCEYNSLFILHRHTREHSSKVEWVKSLDEFKGNKSGLKESRGGLGLWSPYPRDLSSVEFPPVQTASESSR